MQHSDLLNPGHKPDSLQVKEHCWVGKVARSLTTPIIQRYMAPYQGTHAGVTVYSLEKLLHGLTADICRLLDWCAQWLTLLPLRIKTRPFLLSADDVEHTTVVPKRLLGPILQYSVFNNDEEWVHHKLMENTEGNCNLHRFVYQCFRAGTSDLVSSSSTSTSSKDAATRFSQWVFESRNRLPCECPAKLSVAVFDSVDSDWCIIQRSNHHNHDGSEEELLRGKHALLEKWQAQQAHLSSLPYTLLTSTNNFASYLKHRIAAGTELMKQHQLPLELPTLELSGFTDVSTDCRQPLSLTSAHTQRGKHGWHGSDCAASAPSFMRSSRNDCSSDTQTHGCLASEDTSSSLPTMASTAVAADAAASSLQPVAADSVCLLSNMERMRRNHNMPQRISAGCFDVSLESVHRTLTRMRQAERPIESKEGDVSSLLHLLNLYKAKGWGDMSYRIEQGKLVHLVAFLQSPIQRAWVQRCPQLAHTVSFDDTFNVSTLDLSLFGAAGIHPSTGSAFPLFFGLCYLPPNTPGAKTDAIEFLFAEFERHNPEAHTEMLLIDQDAASLAAWVQLRKRKLVRSKTRLEAMLQPLRLVGNKATQTEIDAAKLWCASALAAVNKPHCATLIEMSTIRQRYPDLPPDGNSSITSSTTSTDTASDTSADGASATPSLNQQQSAEELRSIFNELFIYRNRGICRGLAWLLYHKIFALGNDLVKVESAAQYDANVSLLRALSHMNFAAVPSELDWFLRTFVSPSIRLCTFHVTKCWREQMQKKGVGLDSDKMLNHLCAIMYDLNPAGINRKWNAFQTNYVKHSAMIDYLKAHYFTNHYHRLWCSAYRNIPRYNQNTTNPIEAFWNVLKHTVLLSKRTSSTIRVLEELIGIPNQMSADKCYMEELDRRFCRWQQGHVPPTENEHVLHVRPLVIEIFSRFHKDKTAIQQCESDPNVILIRCSGASSEYDEKVHTHTTPVGDAAVETSDSSTTTLSSAPLRRSARNIHADGETEHAAAGNAGVGAGAAALPATAAIHQPPHPTHYRIHVAESICSCPQFVRVCKHILAARIYHLNVLNRPPTWRDSELDFYFSAKARSRLLAGEIGRQANTAHPATPVGAGNSSSASLSENLNENPNENLRWQLLDTAYTIADGILASYLSAKSIRNSLSSASSCNGSMNAAQQSQLNMLRTSFAEMQKIVTDASTRLNALQLKVVSTLNHISAGSKSVASAKPEQLDEEEDAAENELASEPETEAVVTDDCSDSSPAAEAEAEAEAEVSASSSHQAVQEADTSMDEPSPAAAVGIHSIEEEPLGLETPDNSGAAEAILGSNEAEEASSASDHTYRKSSSIASRKAIPPNMFVLHQRSAAGRHDIPSRLKARDGTTSSIITPPPSHTIGRVARQRGGLSLGPKTTLAAQVPSMANEPGAAGLSNSTNNVAGVSLSAQSSPLAAAAKLSTGKLQTSAGTSTPLPQQPSSIPLAAARYTAMSTVVSNASTNALSTRTYRPFAVTDASASARRTARKQGNPPAQVSRLSNVMFAGGMLPQSAAGDHSFIPAWRAGRLPAAARIALSLPSAVGAASTAIKHHTAAASGVKRARSSSSAHVQDLEADGDSDMS